MNAVVRELVDLCYKGIKVEVGLFSRGVRHDGSLILDPDVFQITMTYKNSRTRQLIYASDLSTDDRIVTALEYIKDMLVYREENKNETDH